MHLLNLTLQSPSIISHAIYGNFTAAKAQEIAVIRGNVLELLRPDDQGQLQSILRQPLFSTVRSVRAFRLTGTSKDYLILGSDAGSLAVLEYAATSCSFVARHCEVFGKTGCRRIIPGQYLAVDPKGRAIMIGAVEKQKLVYVMNRDASNRLTISSPLEAHRASAIHFDMVGLDVGFENPVFASLELNYAEVDQDSSSNSLETLEKHLVLYELDLGLNHVTRKWSCVVPRSSHKLLPVPGGQDGPGGVIVCAKGLLVYRHEDLEGELSCVLPQRHHHHSNDDNQKDQHSSSADMMMMIVASALHKQRDLFFILAQTEMGDVFKITLDISTNDEDEGEVTKLNVRLFDTLPLASGLCITRTGFLFLASEFANHFLFQFQGLGDQTTDVIEMSSGCSKDADDPVARFYPRALVNLVVVDQLESLAPIVDCALGDYAEEDAAVQLVALCGRAERSSVRILRHGLAVSEMAVSELPGHPQSVWCIKEKCGSKFYGYIVIGFPNASLVLAIGEAVEEVTDSGLLTESPTLLATRMADESLLQIYPGGVRHIRSQDSVTEWKAPGKKVIEHCAANARQVILSLAGGEVVYFELEAVPGSTHSTLTEKISTELGMEIASLDLGQVPQDKARFPFLAVGGWDNTVRILSLDPQELMRQRSTLALTSPCESLRIAEMATASNREALVVSSTDENNHNVRSRRLYLHLGLHNGVFQWTELDRVTGTLSNSRSRFLGSKKVKLFQVKIQDENAMLALSSRSWLSYQFQSQSHLTPLSYESLHAACAFASEQCPEGVVAVTGNTLRILSIDRLGEVFNHQHLPLRYTPRRVVYHVPSKKLVWIASDRRAFAPAEFQQKNAPYLAALEKGKSRLEGEEAPEEEEEEVPAFQLRGPLAPQSSSHAWGGILHVFDPIENTQMCEIQFQPNEGPISLSTCVFHDRGGEVFVLVGFIMTSSSSNVEEKSAPAQYCVRVYRILEDGKHLVFVHETPLEDIPSVMCAFQGRLLLAVGKTLRIYDLGKRKLLRKCEYKHPGSSRIIKLSTAGSRIYLTDVSSGFHFLKYHTTENQLSCFADDTTARYLTCHVVLDYDTIAGGDKFGQLSVCRLPSDVSEEMENVDPTGNRMLWDAGQLNGAPNKLIQVAQFHVGEVVTSISRTRLVPGGLESLVYTTVSGRVGALVPFSSREEVDFYTHLEMYMRQEYTIVTGRDHLAYRSAYIPVKNVTDGDLCELFEQLPLAKQQRIAQDLDRSIAEISKKLQDFRNRLL